MRREYSDIILWLEAPSKYWPIVDQLGFLWKPNETLENWLKWLHDIQGIAHTIDSKKDNSGEL
jgi:hypothetical protein